MSDFSDKILELYPWMRDRARFYYRNREDIEDLVSETVFRLLSNYDKYDRSYDLKPWCVVVMKNIYSNQYQRSKIVPFVGYQDEYAPSVLDSSDYREIESILDEKSLQSVNVYCVKLYAQGYTYEEISEMLDIKLGTVRSRIYNGRKMLRSALEI